LLFVEGDLQRDFGENLRRYRQQRGLSQEAFAQVLGVHRTYMGGIERGERNLTLRSVERIADQLRMKPLDLLRHTRRSKSRSR
jgi:transcriptional regulator with XRE-family HTH domain